MSDILNWLFEQKPWNGVGDFDLNPMKSACSLFGNPQDKFKSVHVAGTNGKGSVVAYMRSILSSEGHLVGSTISPHLQDVNERIDVGGMPISDFDLKRVVEVIRSRVESAGLRLSFFECMILAAFVYFAERKVDYGVIEVGLGGRLDATNVLKTPEAAVITSIGLDHQHILGQTVEEIAREKAGIGKGGVPVFLGHLDLDISTSASKEIENVVESVGGTIRQLGKDFHLVKKKDGHTLRIDEGEYSIRPNLRGEHQLRNASLAAAVAHHLGISKKSIEEGVSNAFWPGRLELIPLHDRSILIDCAHNTAGFQTLASYLEEWNPSGEITAIVGFLKTKQWTQMLDIIDKYVSSYVVARPDSTQAEDLTLIDSYLRTRGKISSIHDGALREVVRRLLSDEFQGKNILLVGSIYLIAELRSHLFQLQGEQFGTSDPR
ncbi:MAG: bifunctional folylpolyglutamate synthase/dihydrofolate synthase [Bdellovibrionota bacterium]